MKEETNIFGKTKSEQLSDMLEWGVHIDKILIREIDKLKLTRCKRLKKLAKGPRGYNDKDWK